MPISNDTQSQQTSSIEFEPVVHVIGQQESSEELRQAAQARIDAFQSLDAGASEDEKKIAELRYWTAFEDYNTVIGYSEDEKNEQFYRVRPLINQKLGIQPEEPSGELFDQDNIKPNQSTAPEESLQALTEILNQKRRDYARWTAICRTRSSRRSRSKLEQARQEYEQARDQAGAVVANLAFPESFNDLKVMATAGAVEELKLLETDIVKERLSLSESKRLKGFYNWWARQGGSQKFIKGKLQKSAIIGGIGFVSGLAVGTAGAALLGPALGVTAGAIVARSVSRGLAAAKINREAEAVSVARAQSLWQFGESRQKINTEAERLGNNGNVITTKNLTDHIELNTKKEIGRNRTRILGGAAIGLATGLIGAGIGWFIHDQLFSSHHDTPGPKKTTPSPKDTRPGTGGTMQPTTPVRPTTPPTITTPPITSSPTPPTSDLPPFSAPKPVVNLNQWSWDVAHQVSPGHEVQALNQAMASFSEQTGQTAHLVPHGGTTMIQVGNHIVNQAEMRQINELLATP